MLLDLHRLCWETSKKYFEDHPRYLRKVYAANLYPYLVMAVLIAFAVSLEK